MMDQALLKSLTVKIELLEQQVSDHAQRFDTLQTPLWKRLWFRIDGFRGNLTEVAVYPTALSQARVVAHYSAAFTDEPPIGFSGRGAGW